MKTFSLVVLLSLICMPAYAMHKPTNPEPLREVSMKAERGDPQAQYKLGVMYEYGLFVPKNYIETYYWFSRVAANPVRAAGTGDAPRLRARIASRLTPAQVENVERGLAQEGF